MYGVLLCWFLTPAPPIWELRGILLLPLPPNATHLYQASFERGILLLPLPPNATHLYQPLDVAMLNRLKRCSACTISKTDAIGIACNAYRAALTTRPSNAVNGFRTTGLYPPSLLNMQGRLRLFASDGARGNLGKAEWLKRKREIQSEVRSSILLLPLAPGSKGKRRRVTVDFERRLNTKEMLQQGDMTS
ncbi:hypothetical protein PHMEG_00019945 [Phytophthora megakarya]|uniref:DDE-1 domain-containing protein n=1 Tax=Phytophthora megakarya TaxID=4795 RepID=A0A225VS84_9STRA|nr:hypothetical protein PHMEG_00019945 [Phytophthora megakarya]